MFLDIASHHNRRPAGKIRRRNEEIILKAAEYEFAVLGFEGATMQKIALRAKLPKSNVHYYFKNKASLYADVLASIIELWDDALNQLDPSQSAELSLREYIATKMRFSRDYPIASRVFAREILSGAPRLDGYFEDHYRKWFKSKVKVFQSWINQGEIDELDPATIIFLIWSATQHYADFSVQIASANGKLYLDDSDYEKATESLSKIILSGIGASRN